MRFPLLARLTSLPAIAVGAALGMTVAGILAVIGGSYAHSVVREQLVPQKIRFAPAGSPALPPQIADYAGRAVIDGSTAKVFADKYIAVHLKAIASGQTYAQVSAQSLANPRNATLAQETQTLFRGETLRGLLLQAWGWGKVGTIALIAGWVLIGVGLMLLTLPVLNLLLNGRREPAAASP
jgi:hypothetical protein